MTQILKNFTSDLKNNNFFKDFNWNNIPILSIITGLNGSGKTQLLKAIYIKLSQDVKTKNDVFFLKHLEGLEIEYFSQKLKGTATGIVVDWYDGFTKHPEQHKPLHLIAMNDGNYYLLPNNFLRWFDPSFVEESKWSECKGYRRGSQVWLPENKNSN